MASQVIRSTFLIFLLLSLNAQASSPAFTDVTAEDLENITRDITGIFAHTTVSAAALYNNESRVELGLVVGSAETPHIDEISQRSDSEADVSMIPHASLVGTFYLGDRLRFEVSYLPEIKTTDTQLGSQSIAAQYTATDPTKPGLDAALKFYVTSSDLRFKQSDTSGNSDIRFKSNVSGLMLVFSEKILILEPYFGIGRVNSVGKLKVDGTGSVFDTSYTTSSKAEESVTGTHLIYGINFDIFALQAGLEVSRVFNANKISAKFSFNF